METDPYFDEESFLNTQDYAFNLYFVNTSIYCTAYHKILHTWCNESFLIDIDNTNEVTSQWNQEHNIYTRHTAAHSRNVNRPHHAAG